MTVNNFKTSIIYYLLNPNIQFDELSSRLLIFKIFFYICIRMFYVATTNFNTSILQDHVFVYVCHYDYFNGRKFRGFAVFC